MNLKKQYISLLFTLTTLTVAAQEKRGADIPWTTYEAENMKTNGTVLGPKYDAFQVETESSGQKCVKLSSKNQYVQFKSSRKANTIVVRFSLPDNQDGTGTKSTLGVYLNGKLSKSLDVSSMYSHLYGNYPFSNDPKEGKHRHYYNEVRTKDLEINQGDEIKIQRDDKDGDNAEFCIIDLVDLEQIEAPLAQPENSLSITDKTFTGENFSGDYSEALKRCIDAASKSKKTVWIPAGTFIIGADIAVPKDVTIKGAGMWHTTLLGVDTLYTNYTYKRVRIIGTGGNIHLSDFAIIGKLNYRDDSEWNDGIVGSFGINSTISRIWIEHTKIGVWVENSQNLVVEGCRFRNTIADGINFCVGMNGSTIKNCTTRGTGDDCFAMWPATFLMNRFKPGHNVIMNCTGQLPWLANGAAIYGGEDNKISNCIFTDISPGSAILISTTFPTEDPKVNNHFSGTTVVENCDIRTSGGFDHSWDWRGSIQIALDRRGISGLEIRNVNIENSMSNGIDIVTRLEKGKAPELSNAVFRNVKITKSGLGAKGKFGFWVDKEAHGGVTVENCKLGEVKIESPNFTITKK